MIPSKCVNCICIFCIAISVSMCIYICICNWIVFVIGFVFVIVFYLYFLYFPTTILLLAVLWPHPGPRRAKHSVLNTPSVRRCLRW